MTEPSDSSPDSSCEWCDVESSPPPQSVSRPNDTPAATTDAETRVNNSTKHKKNSARTLNNVGADADTAGSEAAVESHKPRVSERGADVGCRREGGKMEGGKMEEEAAFDHLAKTTENVMAWITEVCDHFSCVASLSLFKFIFTTVFFFHRIFSRVYVESMYLTSCLRTAQLCVCSPDSPFSLMSSFTLSIHLRFDLPFLLFPSTSILITPFPTYSASLLVIRQYHFHLLSY